MNSSNLYNPINNQSGGMFGFNFLSRNNDDKVKDYDSKKYNELKENVDEAYKNLNVYLMKTVFPEKFFLDMCETKCPVTGNVTSNPMIYNLFLKHCMGCICLQKILENHSMDLQRKVLNYRMPSLNNNTVLHIATMMCFVECCVKLLDYAYEKKLVMDGVKNNDGLLVNKCETETETKTYEKSNQKGGGNSLQYSEITKSDYNKIKNAISLFKDEKHNTELLTDTMTMATAVDDSYKSHSTNYNSVGTDALLSELINKYLPSQSGGKPKKKSKNSKNSKKSKTIKGKRPIKKLNRSRKSDTPGQLGRAIKKQEDIIHNRVVDDIIKLMNVSEEVARDYKAGLWAKLKEQKGSKFNPKERLDNAIALQNMVNMKELKTIDPNKAKKIREQNKEKRDQHIKEKKTSTSSANTVTSSESSKTPKKMNKKGGNFSSSNDSFTLTQLSESSYSL